MKKIVYTGMSCAVAATALFGGGYRIPEVSTNAVALCAANTAHIHGADTAYYNPANMVFMDEKKNTLEADMLFIHLDGVEYQGDNGGRHNGVDIESQEESFALPELHYVSPKLGKNARVGLSIVIPGGLSKRWNDSPAKEYAKEFTLEIVEVNPSMAVQLSPTLAVGAGMRLVYSKGIVKSEGPASRDMNGDTMHVGYNLALSYKPTKEFEAAVTYRSNVTMDEAGDAKLYVGNALAYDGGADVSIPLPAIFKAALAYTFAETTTVEVVFDRTFWSQYKALDFNYVGSVPAIIKPYFDDPIPKKWKNSNAYRIGVTHILNEQTTLMAGAVYDNTPVPGSSVGFELPDSDSLAFSLGGRYKIDDNFDVAFAGLYSMHESRDVNNRALDGKLSDGNVLIISAGLGYKF